MKDMETNTYFAYMRKSSEGEDKQVQSIDRQHDEITRLIQSRDLKVAEFFAESRSAMIPHNRPEFSRMIKAIEKGHANGIICWHLNRLSRNPYESGVIEQLLRDEKIKRIITKDRDYMPADNAIIFGVESSLAAQYSTDLSKMVKSGTEKKIAQGIAPIHAPIGYLNTKNREHGSNYILPDPDLFPLVRKVWDLMLTGQYTPPRILEYISNDIGLRKKLKFPNNSGTLSRSSLYRLLTNPFYAGQFYFNGVLYNGIHKPMITLEEFDRVQRLLGRDGKPRYTAHQFTYTGIMKCANCSSAITATEKNKLIKSTGLHQTYIYYYCSKRKKGGQRCDSKPIPVTKFEDILIDNIEKLSISSDYKNIALRVIKQNLQNMVTEENTVTKHKEEEIHKIEKELKNLLSLRLNETITDTEYLEAKKERETQVTRLKKSIENNGSTTIDLIAAIDQKLSTVTDLKNEFMKSSPEGKKSLLLSIGWNHTLKDNKLLFDKAEWLNVLSENKDTLMHEIERLELENSIETYNHLQDLRDMCPVLRRLVDAVGTEINYTPEPHPLKHKKSDDDG